MLSSYTFIFYEQRWTETDPCVKHFCPTYIIHAHNHAAQRVHAVQKDVHLHKIYILVDLLCDDFALSSSIACRMRSSSAEGRLAPWFHRRTDCLLYVLWCVRMPLVVLGNIFQHANERVNDARAYNDHHIERAESRDRTAKVWGSVSLLVLPHCASALDIRQTMICCVKYVLNVVRTH